MKYYLDTEFIDDGKTIDLISIGIVCEDGREYYAQSGQFNPNMASQWVEDNVFVHLTPCPNYGSPDRLHTIFHRRSGQCLDPHLDPLDLCPFRTREQIRQEVRQFFNPSNGFTLYGWCSGYDFVAFCQLFGTMMDLPAGWPHYINDLQQTLDEERIADDQLPQQEGTAHNALADARYIKKIWEYLHTISLVGLYSDGSLREAGDAYDE